MMDMQSSASFWDYLEKLVISSRLEIDRPKGTCHPSFPDLVYPLDYGYLEGAIATDGAGIDVWLGDSRGLTLCAIVLTVDLYKKDTEIKILLGCTGQEIQTILDFHNTKYMWSFLVRWPDISSSSQVQFSEKETKYEHDSRITQ